MFLSKRLFDTNILYISLSFRNLRKWVFLRLAFIFLINSILEFPSNFFWTYYVCCVLHHLCCFIVPLFSTSNLFFCNFLLFYNLQTSWMIYFANNPHRGSNIAVVAISRQILPAHSTHFGFN